MEEWQAGQEVYVSRVLIDVVIIDRWGTHEEKIIEVGVLVGPTIAVGGAFL